MSRIHENKFNPDYAIHPGEILEETLEARGIKKHDLATRCQISTKHLSQIINGKAPVTADTAIQLERALGVSANIWNNLESQYRLFGAQQKENESLQKSTEWLNDFPVSELNKRGYIEKSSDDVETLKSLLQFLGVSSPGAFKEQWEQMTPAVLYRSAPKFESSRESIASWLRICELEAENVDTEPFDSRIFRSNLESIRSLTCEDPEVFEPKIKKFCSDAGVCLVFVKELPQTRLCGATRWLASNKALLMLSLRYKWEDIFWFTFFHEAAHILFHSKRKIFVEETTDASGPQEEEANDFASDFLIPKSDYKKLTKSKVLTRTVINDFASSQGIAPSIVVGRLQHDGIIGFDTYNDLRRRFTLEN
ncbi:MAG: HigA family addiction module antidote protein [Actinobacteria bacterium]|nr:HigA family addiction module antidote protein [Actinomycetota bacterium]